MGEKRVADLTVGEFKALINQVLNERLGLQAEQPVKKRSLQEVFESIDRHIWTPPPGAKSSLEMLREDRDS